MGARALLPAADVRYVAGDVRERVLRRVRRRARRRGLAHVQTTFADLSRLPFADGEIDVFLCFDGIQWVEDPASAMAEIARCLAPGGRLIGTSFFSGMGVRGRLLARVASRWGCLPAPGRQDLYRWMREAGLVEGTLSHEDGFAEFDAFKPPAAPAASRRSAAARRR